MRISIELVFKGKVEVKRIGERAEGFDHYGSTYLQDEYHVNLDIKSWNFRQDWK